jgi:hypothetical protein
MTEQTRAAQPPSARRRSKQVHTCARVRTCVRSYALIFLLVRACVTVCVCVCVRASGCAARLVVPTGLAANTLPACAEVVDAERGHRALLQPEVLHHVPAESGRRCGRVPAQMWARPGQMWASPGQMWANPGADVGESRYRCGRIPVQMWASPGADVGECRCRCGRIPAEGACPCWLVDAMRTRSLALNSAATCAEQCWATSAPGVGHICAGTRPHLRPNPPTSAPGLAHICAGTHAQPCSAQRTALRSVEPQSRGRCGRG